MGFWQNILNRKIYSYGAKSHKVEKPTSEKPNTAPPSRKIKEKERLFI